MHDELLSDAIKDAGEKFEPPPLDVRAVAQRGRRRWWLTRAVAVTTSLALAAGAAAVVARVDVPEPRPVPAAAPLEDWEPIEAAPISGRVATASAWTGRELIVTGGTAADTGLPLGEAAAYDPATDEWEEIPPPPEPMYGHTAVWTGREIILWGGEGDDDGRPPGSGFAFDPATREWRELPEAPYWSLGGHSAVWTGEEMIVWGGVIGSGRVRAASYDPAADEWRRIPNGPLPSRSRHEAVWAGDRMIVWGGWSQSGVVALDFEGAEYDPATRKWAPLPLSPLDGRDPVSFWTGAEMVLTGGYGAGTASRAGVAYDPAQRRWREIADVPVATARGGAPIALVDVQTTPVWTGERAVFVTADGVLSYDPEADEWSKVPAPRDAWRTGATVAWTGDEMVVWSGRAGDGNRFLTSGWSAR